MSKRSAWSRVEAARNPSRPTATYYINTVFDGFMEFHGDRYFGDDAAIVGGIAWLGKTPVTVIGQQKGTTTKEKIQRNFGSPHPEGYRKALRLAKQAEKFGRPIIFLVDTQGAYSGAGAEERGQGRAIADNLMQLMGVKTPTISVIIGEGGSGGALALAVADKVALLENGIYSILTPEGFAAILWRDGTRAREAAEVMKLTAQDLFELGVVDEVIEEVGEGAHSDPEAMAERLKEYLVKTVKELSKKPVDKLLDARYKKFRAMGS